MCHYGGAACNVTRVPSSPTRSSSPLARGGRRSRSQHRAFSRTRCSLGQLHRQSHSPVRRRSQGSPLHTLTRHLGNMGGAIYRIRRMNDMAEALLLPLLHTGSFDTHRHHRHLLTNSLASTSPFLCTGKQTQRKNLLLAGRFRTLAKTCLTRSWCSRGCVRMSASMGGGGTGEDVVKSERGVKFVVGEGFFREESREGRDLGVLAAAVYRNTTGRLRVMDLMCGCGLRAARYLSQANADFVWANDANEDTRSTILSNLSLYPSSKWLLSHGDANRIMCQRYLLDDYYDLIDVDCFGSSSSFFASTFSAVRHGGLVYLTSTDGVSAGGHSPHNALTSYGAFIRPMPYANEIGLRMLIGGAVREAATRNLDVRPVFSLFSYHGPVFRAMLQVARGVPQKNRHYGFISYCRLCGDSLAFSWENMGQIFCPCSERKAKSRSLVVSGPLWTGPLHSRIKICEMLELAEEWGWAIKEECSFGSKNANLKKLLTLMLEESTPELPFGYIKLDEIARRGKINCLRRDDLIDILKK
ncbi:hypothetical protein KI387_005859, partial [Taxus chinensis]